MTKKESPGCNRGGRKVGQDLETIAIVYQYFLKSQARRGGTR